MTSIVSSVTRAWLISTAVVSLLFMGAAIGSAQTATFTYQGRLQDTGTAANGAYDLQFRLFDALISGNQVGTTVVREDVLVNGGVFTVSLGFGAAAFPGADRFLEVSARPGTSTGAYVALSPLQAITSTPYALQSLNAADATTAANAIKLGGLAASQYVLTGDSRLADSRAPTAGSTSYVQNSASQQTGSNFNISGSGAVGGTFSANQIGIQTTNPRLGSLDVHGNVFVGEVISFVGSGSGNLFLANEGGDFRNSFRIDGSADTLYLIADSQTGSTSGAGIAFRTSGAGGGEFDRLLIDPNGRVGIGTSSPSFSLDVVDRLRVRQGPGGSAGIWFYQNAPNANQAFVGMVDDTRVGFYGGSGGGWSFFTDTTTGVATLSSLGTGGATALCRNAVNVISTCSSSLRYKTNVASYDSGLDLVNRLHPISFDWKDSQIHDIGFGAEEVESVEPLLTFRNDKGEIEGVKYNQLSAVFVNAFKEQQAQIQHEQQQIDQQQSDIDVLRKLVCLDHPIEVVCKRND